MHEEDFVFIEVDASLHAESIVSMFNECFSREVSIEQFKWKYLKSYPEKVRTWAAIEKNTERNVGYYSAFKMNFVFNGENIIAYQGFDAMVLREFRRFKIFSKLAMVVKEDLEKENIDLYFGFCNEKSLQAILKSNNKAVEMRSGYSFYYPIGASNLSRKILSSKNFSRTMDIFLTPLFRSYRKLLLYTKKNNLNIEVVSDLNYFKTNQNHCFQSLHCLFPLRSEKYFNWKIFLAPKDIQSKIIMFRFRCEGHDVGFCICTKDELRNAIVLRSLMCNDSMFIREILLCLLKFALNDKSDGIITNSVSALFQDELKKFGFIKSKRILGFLIDMQNKFGSNLMNDNFLFLEPIDRDTFTY